MRRADRLFQLVQLLRNRRFATAQQLADELEGAVAARAVRGLVEAGFVEQADAADAVAALVSDDLIQRALTQEGSA